MKKVFENPEMNISLFEAENVLTVSGGQNLVDAKASFGTSVSAGDLTEVNFGDIGFVL